MNKIILIGNLTRDPELSELPSGVSICKFAIAVGRSFTNSNGERETDFFNVTAWRGLGENCAKYLTKGKKVCVVGNVEMGEYTDRDGVRRFTTTVVAEDVEFLSPKESEPQKSNDGAKPKKKTVEELCPIESEDLPF